MKKGTNVIQTFLFMSCAGEGTINFIELSSHSVAIVLGLCILLFKNIVNSHSIFFPGYSWFWRIEVMKHNQIILGISVAMATYPG